MSAQGARGEECLLARVILASVRRVSRDLAEALDRTPPTVSSRPLIEGALRLSLGAVNASLDLLRLLGCGSHAKLEDLDVAEASDSEHA